MVSEPSAQVDMQQIADQVLQIVAEMVRTLENACHNFVVQFLVVFRGKRSVSGCQLVAQYSERPPIGRLPVTFADYYFWCYVFRSTTKSVRTSAD